MKENNLTDIPNAFLKVIVGAIVRFAGIFKRSGKRMEKPKSKPEPVKTVEKKPEEVKEPKEDKRELSDRLADMEKLRREKTLKKIKRIQEKQRRKFK